MFPARAFRTFIALALLSLSGCGFHSVYGGKNDDDSPVAAQLNQVAIDNISERSGQILRNALIDRLYNRQQGGRPALPAYHLSVQPRMNSEDTGTLPNATTTLSTLQSRADYQLTDAAGKGVLHGTAHSAALYDKLSDQYATLAAYNGAVERTMRDIADQITARLSLHFAENGTAP